MPRMSPPHYQGVKYNGHELEAPHGTVEVLPQDVDALLGEGWRLEGHLEPVASELDLNPLAHTGGDQ